MILATNEKQIDRLKQLSLNLGPLTAERFEELANRSREQKLRGKLLEEMIAHMIMEVSVREMLYYSLVALWQSTDPDLLTDGQVETIEESIRLATEYREHFHH